MNEIYAALVGASASAFLMVLSNRSSKSNNTFRELFHRMNAVEKDIARLEANRPRNWRGQ
tara:strand:- start:208 stop:387 length:180 start_codon:yes stop_codon:yes gene_type:complete